MGIKNLFFKLFKLLVCAAIWGAAAVFASPKLTFEFVNIEKTEGKLFIALVDSEDAYNRKDTDPGDDGRVFKAMINVKSKDVSISVTGLQPGSYAAMIFHDVNGNSVLDTNSLKIPKEPYGFSNNPRAIFGRPKFKDALFTLGEDDLVLEIKLK